MAYSSPLVTTNLQNFLQSVTPLIPSPTIDDPSSLQDITNPWMPAGKPRNDCFYLAQLWECFDQWSAYGVGTQIVLNDGEVIDQYYVPYLSAIQIYTVKPRVVSAWTPKGKGKMVVNHEDPFWSVTSDNSNTSWNFGSGNSSPNDAPFGNLYFEYYDTGSPYWRIPLYSRVAEYIDNYPGLCGFWNSDLSPASWMAVAWYPIYQIPNKLDIPEMQACFLTYHTLSAYYQETFSTVGDDYATTLFPPRWQIRSQYYPKTKVKKLRNYIYLQPFGLATYRLQGDVWINPYSSDAVQLYDLHNTACSWLKQLNVYHHDFNFFNMHSHLEAMAM